MSQAGLWKPAAFQQAGQCLCCRHALRFHQLAYRERVQAPRVVAASERLAALPEGLHAGAVGDEHGLPFAAPVPGTFEEGLPVAHLVDFVEHDQPGLRRPSLLGDELPVCRHIPVEALGRLEVGHQLARQRGFAGLACSGQHHQLATQVASQADGQGSGGRIQV